MKNNQSESNGSIVNLSSVVAKYGNLGQANYSASKAGVEGFSRSVAKELAKYKIRCNVILPGFIKTPMTDKVPSKYLEQMVRMVPMGRVGLPNDIADLALFLASDSSSYITGSSIECSGGLSF
jgi:17beta-estradiol 17-dehydrogenase/3alpha(17beta)-hydroxysteroid dehydrogenase (NAD+)